MTEYIVLARNNDGCWIEGPTIEAASAEAAVRGALDGDARTEKAFVAIPARSWKPVTVIVETVKHVRIGEPTTATPVEEPAAA